MLPLSNLIIWHGLQQWIKYSSVSANVSHSDCFTYHLVIMELVAVIGCMFCCSGIYIKDTSIVLIGDYLWCFSWFGETLFHTLTCVEHYLAVLQPIVYKNLRKGKGVKIRNNTICAVWLLCIAATCSMLSKLMIGNYLIWIVGLAVVTFCNLSVLSALIRPRPGGKCTLIRKPLHQKHRAIFTIAAILVVLTLRTITGLFWLIADVSKSRPQNQCLLMAFSMWLTLPSSLLLPLLYLSRALKRQYRNNAK